MDQIKRIWNSLSARQRVTIAVTALLVAGCLYGFTSWNRERDFRPLFSNLTGEDAAAALTRLRENGVQYRLADNGATIKVPSSKVDEQRIQLASSGLPRSGRIGYELFDKTNFGASDFAEQVNFHRAVEGELERSIMTLSEVEMARVHVTFPRKSVFLENREPAKASVLVKLRPGVKLSPQNVQAICHLTASAVEGLAPESVTVLDMKGNLLSRPRHPLTEDAAASEGLLEYRQRLEKDLLLKIQSTLEPLLGAEKFRAGVSVECDLTSGEQSEENFDPNKSVMLTSQKTEDISGAPLAAGVPGTASNLPRPASRPATGLQGTSRKTDNVAFQTSRLIKHLRLPQGALKRMSIALLVDHQVRWTGQGAQAKRMLEAPSPEKLKSIRDLVAGAVGLSTERGDQLIVESLPFESTLQWEPPAQAPERGKHRIQLPKWIPEWLRTELEDFINDLVGQKLLLPLIAGLILLALAVPWLLARVVLNKRKFSVDSEGELPAGEHPRSLPRGRQHLETGGSGASPGQTMQEQLEKKLADQSAERERLEKEALDALKLPTVTTQRAEVLAKHISEEAKKQPEATAQLVRSWLNEHER